MKVELYNLLPAVYRNRDFALEEPLRALVNVLEDEIDILRQDIDRLHDNWFIETCDEWVVQYIGDLLAASGLHPGREGIFSLRAFVANTLAYRRRKGTASVLENIAQDVSGWSAAVTEFFQLITVTQHLSHPRPTTVWALGDQDAERIGSVGSVDIRKERLMASVDSAFDTTSRTIDIRPFGQYHGWHNIDRLGVFIWRLRSYPMENVPPREIPGEPNRFYMHPLGLSVPLFTNPERQSGATERRREWEVPQAIDPDAFAADLERYYGAEKSILVTVAGVAIPASSVAPAGSPFAGDDQPARPWAYIDVERGELKIDPIPFQRIDSDTVRVSYHHGFSADIGGGPYGRSITEIDAEQEIIRVAKGSQISTLRAALTRAGLQWYDRRRSASSTVIRIMDSGTYQEEEIRAYLPPGEELVIEAAEGARPAIILDSVDGDATFLVLVVANGEPCPPEPMCHVRLSGLLVEGRIWAEGDLEMEIEHCTIVPSPQAIEVNRYALYVPRNSFSFRLRLDVYKSILGRIRTDADIRHLSVRDSIVDAFMSPVESPQLGDDGLFAVTSSASERSGCSTSFERSTIFGAVRVRAMPLASESIFAHRVTVDERQNGCMKYCYIAEIHDSVNAAESVSRTPGRFRCQPDLALQGVVDATERSQIRQRVQPLFSTTDFGQPNYGRLSWRCAEEIRTGAENGSEMGVFSHLMEPQRESNLREGIRRYLPFGLEINVIYADEETKS